VNKKPKDNTLPSEEERYKNYYMSVLHNIKEKQNFKGELPSKNSLFHLWAEQVPFLEEVIYHLDDIGASAGLLIEMKDSFSHAAKLADSTVRAFSIVSLVIAALDFIRIPGIYIASAVLGREVPFKLTNAAKWGYSAVILGLTIGAFAAPVIAPIFTVAIASLVFAVSAFTLGRFFYKRAKKRTALAQLTKEHGDIDTAEEQLEKIQFKSDGLMQKMKAFETLDPSQQEELLDKVDKLDTKFKDKKAEIQKLYDKRKKLEVALEMSAEIARNKSVGLVLSAAILTGFALSLVFPPVGLAVLISASAAAVAFLVGKAVLPRLKNTRLGAWLTARFKSKAQATEAETQISPAKTAELETELPVHEKTVDIMRKLFGSARTEETLRQLVLDTQKMGDLDRHFTKIVKKKDEKEAVLFFNRLAFKANIHKLTPENINNFLEQLASFEQGKALLKQGLAKVQSGEFPGDIAENLFANTFLAKVLDMDNPRPANPDIARQKSVITDLEDDKEGEGEKEGVGEGEKEETGEGEKEGAGEEDGLDLKL